MVKTHGRHYSEGQAWDSLQRQFSPTISSPAGQTEAQVIQHVKNTAGGISWQSGS